MTRFTIRKQPESLIEGDWVEWSEQFLSDQLSNEYANSDGFRKRLYDDRNKSKEAGGPRSRALEFYRLGLLRGLLHKAPSRDQIPHAWKLLQVDGVLPHSRLGILSYAVGKALKTGHSKKVLDAFSALCTIYILQTGIGNDDRRYMQFSVFKHICDHFGPVPPSTNRREWERCIAAAMFSTLDNDDLRDNLIKSYQEDTPVTELVITYNSSSGTQSAKVIPSNIVSSVGKISSSELIPSRTANYWYASKSTLGFCAHALRCGRPVLEEAAATERDALDANKDSPFGNMIRKPSDGEVPCVIDTAKNLICHNAGAKNKWESLMRTLYEGVLDSLEHLESHHISKDHAVTRTLYAYDPIATSAEDKNDETDHLPNSDRFEVAVNKSDCVAEPKKGDVINISGRRFAIADVKHENDELILTVTRPNSTGEKQPDPSPVPASSGPSESSS